jgi:hemoglobin-like flavoprotein
MKQQQIASIKSSWALVLPIAGPAADIFYNKLFELDPSLRPLFPSDLADQKIKLMATLGRIVSSLDNLPAIMPAVEALGRKHVQYGVRPQHFATVGAALLSTLEVGLGDAWNDETKSAWATAFGVLSQAMMGSCETTKSGQHFLQLSL